MTPEEELELALAEVEAAKRELATARDEVTASDSGKPIRSRKIQRPAKRERRPVHRSELRSECSGTGERFTSKDGLRRTDMTPVITKELNPMERPNEYKYEGIECLLFHDVMEGNTDSDSWKRCKCPGCVEIRK
jgi:hypothetical protein